MRIALFTWDTGNTCGISFAEALSTSPHKLESVYARPAKDDKPVSLYRLCSKYGFTLHTFPKHNDGTAAAQAMSENLDLIVISGDGILKRSVYGAARYGAINFHTGITPKYRGNSTLYWALMNEEPDMVGFTIHRMTDIVDAGPVIYQEQVPIYARDRYDDIFNRCIIRGTTRTIEICNLIESTGNHITTDAQDLTMGAEYQGVPTKTQWDEFHARMQSKQWQERMVTRHE